MPETFDNVTITDRLTIKDPAGTSHIIIDSGAENDNAFMYRNGEAIIGGESPLLENLPDSASLYQTVLKLNEVIDLLHRGGFARES